jgi:cytochrome o ubiquinol oxidase subunit IV
MSHEPASAAASPDRAPGEESDSFLPGLTGYVIGLLLATTLTAISFWIAHSHALWAPGIPVGLCVLAIAQMGVHLVFFLHITSGPDNSNNILALAFGVLIVFLVIAGSLWIMANLNGNMMSMDELMRMQQ